MGDRARRTVAIALAGAGLVALVVFVAVVPRIHGFEHTCDPAFSAPRLAGDGWWAIRGPQLDAPAPLYDAANRTTLVVPGCGHGDAGVAVRVRGDHRGFDRSGDHLVLDAGPGVTGATTAWDVTRDDGRNETLQVLDGTFTARSRVPHAALVIGALGTLAAGVGLLRPSQPRAAVSLPLAAVGGAAFALLGLAADLGLVLFLLVAPLLALVGLVGLVGLSIQWSRAWWLWAAVLAFAVAWWVTFVAMLGAYPLSPDA